MNANRKGYRFETLQIHAGQESAPGADGRTKAIPRDGSCPGHDSARWARLVASEEIGDAARRLTDPDTEMFERRIAALEGGGGALATTSGLAAQFLAISTVASGGDNVVVPGPNPEITRGRR
jgi:O-acetylhomoserine (thiol)-lyase